MPEELGYVWEWFREVCGYEPLTYTELYHWSKITGNDLLGWEADLIGSLDRILRRVQHERHG